MPFLTAISARNFYPGKPFLPAHLPPVHRKFPI